MACCLTAPSHYHNQFATSSVMSFTIYIKTMGLLMHKKRMATTYSIIAHSKPNWMTLQARNWLFFAITWLNYQRRRHMVFIWRQVLRKYTCYQLFKRVWNSTNLNFRRHLLMNNEWQKSCCHLLCVLYQRWFDVMAQFFNVIILNSYNMLHSTEER